MTREPKHGDVFECNDTLAAFTVVGVRRVDGEQATNGPRFHVVMMCVVEPDWSSWLDFERSIHVGDMHHVASTWESLQDRYTLLTA